MMTPTQKKFSEFPIMILLVWIVQALEVSILRVPGVFAPVHFIPVLTCYITVTRNWFVMAALALLFAFLGSSTVGYPWPVYVSALLWTALTLKIVILTFTLEGRRAFTLMTGAGGILFKILVHVILGSTARTLPFFSALRDWLASGLVMAAMAWFLFPVFAAWDAFFEHQSDEARELKPGALR